MLAEYGIVLPQHLTHVRRELPQLVEDKDTRLSDFAKRLFRSLYEELQALDQRILTMESEINQAFQQNVLCQRIGEVEGIGPVTATAVIAAISNGNTFQNGRQFTAWLGLVPRQNSSGEKQRLSGITKRGDCYLRTLLVHGSRSVVFRASKKEDARSKWIAEKQ